jgi:hypothetical protein
LWSIEIALQDDEFTSIDAMASGQRGLSIKRRFLPYGTNTADPIEVNDFIVNPVLLVLLRNGSRGGVRYSCRCRDCVNSPDCTTRRRRRRTAGRGRGYRLR